MPDRSAKGWKNDGGKRALPREEGDLTRKNKAMHGENFLSTWLREDTEGKAAEMKEIRKKNKEEVKRGKRELQGKKATVCVVRKRICNEFLVSVRDFLRRVLWRK